MTMPCQTGPIAESGEFCRIGPHFSSAWLAMDCCRELLSRVSKEFRPIARGQMWRLLSFTVGFRGVLMVTQGESRFAPRYVYTSAVRLYSRCYPTLIMICSTNLPVLVPMPADFIALLGAGRATGVLHPGRATYHKT